MTDNANEQLCPGCRERRERAIAHLKRWAEKHPDEIEAVRFRGLPLDEIPEELHKVVAAYASYHFYDNLLKGR